MTTPRIEDLLEQLISGPVSAGAGATRGLQQRVNHI
jgi:hypothetical protein